MNNENPNITYTDMIMDMIIHTDRSNLYLLENNIRSIVQEIIDDIYSDAFDDGKKDNFRN